MNPALSPGPWMPGTVKADPSCSVFHTHCALVCITVGLLVKE